MIKAIISMMITGFLLCSVQACAAVHPELKPFPAAEKGMERFVVVLPEKTRAEEVDFKVELTPGKTMLTDGVNQVRHGSSIEARPLKGWGYTFYEVTGQDTTMSTMMAAPEGSDEARPLKGWGYTFYEVTGQDTTMSTMMAAPEGSEKVEQFVSGTPLLIRYNSRLPIVVYAPEGYELRYRIWTAGDAGNAVKE